MKKLGILFMAVMVAAIAGCAGDDSSGTTGDLDVVGDLQIDATSGGRTVVLIWAAVADVEGYRVYFKAEGAGDWVEAGEVTGTTFTHNATVAGEYSVLAYDGDNTSSAYATAVSTMPMVFDGTYTIYDNNSAATAHSGFIFFDGTNYGLTGLAGDENFKQDMYAYDDVSKGDNDVSLYSGDEGTFPYGYNSNFQLPSSGVYGNCDPGGFNFGVSLPLTTGDSVVFVELPYTTGNNAYAKIYDLNITPDTTPNGTIVTFSFEYQPTDYGFTLFTNNAN